LTRLLLSDNKYPMLARTVPPVSAGLATLVQIGVWPKLFGTLVPFDFTAFDHAAELSISAKFALLYHRRTPDELMNRMTVLRYANRDVKYAADILAAFQALQKQHSKPSDILCFGLPALHDCKALLRALAEDDAAYYDAYLHAEQRLAAIAEDGLPPGLKELAVGGNDLLALCQKTGMPKVQIGAVLAELWRDTVNGHIPNRRDALLAQAERIWIDSTPHE